ncbi:MAG: CsbD family protein [Pseudomonadota bacterium]
MEAIAIELAPVAAMLPDKVRARWSGLSAMLRRRWRKLTAEDVRHPRGDAEYLAKLLQQRYGVGRREALLQVFEFECGL